MPFNQTQITEQDKFTYFPLGKDFKKQANTIKDQRKEQTKTIIEQEEK